MEQEKIIDVYVANLGKYNEGELVGTWVSLPVSEVELKDILAKKVGLEINPARAHAKAMRGEAVYEEYAIHDYEMGEVLDGWQISEYEHLEDLNLIAMGITMLDDFQAEAFKAQVTYELPNDRVEIMNLIAQADDIAYYPYECSHEDASPEERYGRTVIEYSFSEVRDALEKAGVEYCFDYEKLGRDAGMDCSLDDEGYLDLRADAPDTGRYTREELRDLFAEEWHAQNPEKVFSTRPMNTTKGRYDKGMER